jgi:hypothetical protein
MLGGGKRDKLLLGGGRVTSSWVERGRGTYRGGMKIQSGLIYERTEG